MCGNNWCPRIYCTLCIYPSTHRWGQMLFDNVRHVTVNELTSMRGNGKKGWRRSVKMIIKMGNTWCGSNKILERKENIWKFLEFLLSTVFKIEFRFSWDKHGKFDRSPHWQTFVLNIDETTEEEKGQEKKEETLCLTQFYSMKRNIFKNKFERIQRIFCWVRSGWICQCSLKESNRCSYSTDYGTEAPSVAVRSSGVQSACVEHKAPSHDSFSRSQTPVDGLDHGNSSEPVHQETAGCTDGSKCPAETQDFLGSHGGCWWGFDVGFVYNSGSKTRRPSPQRRMRLVICLAGEHSFLYESKRQLTFVVCFISYRLVLFLCYINVTVFFFLNFMRWLLTYF